MNRTVNIAGKVDPLAVQRTAADIVGDQATGDDGATNLHHLAALHQYVNKNITYAPDPGQGNYIAPPSETIKTGAGDCDCQAVLVASLFEAIGAETRVVLCESSEGNWHALTEVALSESEQPIHAEIIPSLEQYYSDKLLSPATFAWETDDQVVWFLADTAAGEYIGDGTGLADTEFIQGPLPDGNWWWYNSEYQYPHTHSSHPLDPPPREGWWYLEIDPAGYQTSTDEFAARIELATARTDLPGHAMVADIEWGSIAADGRDYGYGLLVNFECDDIASVGSGMLECVRHVEEATCDINGKWE